MSLEKGFSPYDESVSPENDSQQDSFDPHIEKQDPTWNSERNDNLFFTPKTRAVAGLFSLGVLAACSFIREKSPIELATPTPIEAPLGAGSDTVNLAPLFNDYLPATPSETVATPTPVEIVELEERVDPTPFSRIFKEATRFIESIENTETGGSFVGNNLELADPSVALWADFSHPGEIRIVESRDLDEKSWGIYGYKVLHGREQFVPPLYAIRELIINQLFVEGRDVKIIWGDIDSGVSIFFSTSTLQRMGNNPIAVEKGLSVEDITEIVVPLNDDRFDCIPYNNYGTGGIMCTSK